MMEKMVLVAYHKYQKMLEAQSVKIPSAPKKKKKDKMSYPPPRKRDPSPEIRS